MQTKMYFWKLRIGCVKCGLRRPHLRTLRLQVRHSFFVIFCLSMIQVLHTLFSFSAWYISHMFLPSGNHHPLVRSISRLVYRIDLLFLQPVSCLLTCSLRNGVAVLLLPWNSFFIQFGELVSGLVVSPAWGYYLVTCFCVKYGISSEKDLLMFASCFPFACLVSC